MRSSQLQHMHCIVLFKLALRDSNVFYPLRGPVGVVTLETCIKLKGVQCELTDTTIMISLVAVNAWNALFIIAAQNKQ